MIIAPLLFHKIETVLIFQALNFNIAELILVENIFLYIFLLLAFCSNLFLLYKKNVEMQFILLIDFFSVLILNFFLNPIVAFTIYFCFLHSIRHSLSLMFQLNKNIKKGFILFIKKALPLSMITAFLYLLSLYFLNNNSELNESIYKVIFIGLASLTFPHILLEYLIEKKWKIKKLKFY